MAKTKHGLFVDTVSFDGTKHSVGQSVFCSVDGCGETSRIVANNRSHRLPDNVLMNKFRQRGWEIRKDRWVCPAHARPNTDLVERPSPETTPQPSPPLAIAPVVNQEPPPPTFHSEDDKTIMVSNNNEPIRSLGDLANASIAKMSQGDRRRIWRAIDANWDENRARYIGSVGDQSIASDLNVPRAWVEHIRKETFGDSADSEAIQELDENLKGLEKKFNLAVDDAIKLASRFEALAKEARGMRATLDEVKKAAGIRW